MNNQELRQIFAGMVALLQTAISKIDASIEAKPDLAAKAKVKAAEVEDALYIGQSFLFNGSLLTIQYIPNIRNGQDAKIGCTGRVTVIKDGFQNTGASTIYLARGYVEELMKAVPDALVS